MNFRICIKMLLDRVMQQLMEIHERHRHLPSDLLFSLGHESNIWQNVNVVCFVLEMQEKRMSRNSEFGTVPIAPLGCTYSLLIFRRLMIGITYRLLVGQIARGKHSVRVLMTSEIP